MSTDTFNLIVKITSDGAGKLNAELKTASGNLSTFESKTEGAAESTSKFMGVATIAAGIIAAKLTVAVKDFIGQSISMGAQLQTIGAGFEVLVNRASQGRTSLESLRNTTRGMVSDLDLMAAANKAVVLGLPIDRFNELFDVATKLGPVMGRTVTQAVNDLALGIGRQSKMILDNLGIVISLEKSYKEYAVTIGKTGDQLTEIEKKQALFNAVMEQAQVITKQLDDALSDDQKALMRWSASIDNAKTSVGIFLGQKIAPVLEAYTGLLNVATGRQKSWVRSMYEVVDAQDDIADSAENSFTRVVNNVEIAAEALEGYVDAVARVALTDQEFTEMQRAAYDRRLDDLVTHYRDYFNVTSTEYDKLFDIAKDYFDEMRSEEEADHRDRLSEINNFYDDMLAEQRGFLDDIRNSRRTDLNDLELTFLLRKQALQIALDEERISESKHQEALERLETEYRETRSRISDDYRIQELQAERTFSSESQTIEEQRTAAIEAENNDLMIALALIASQEKKDFIDMYQTLLETADRYGISLGVEFEALAKAFGISMDDMQSDARSLTRTLGSVANDIDSFARDFKNSFDVPLDQISDLQDEYLRLQRSIDTISEDNITPPPKSTPKPTKPPSGGGSYKGIPIYPVGRTKPQKYGSDLSVGLRFSIAEVAADLKKLGYAKGFEGMVTKPTLMLVGEKGPEQVSIKNKQQMRSGQGGMGNVSINLPNVTNIGDPAQVRNLFRRIMLELSGER